ncbi:hypothetical protein J7L13_02480 [bacterium]|nr:hypothetical protein [bacterium]
MANRMIVSLVAVMAALLWAGLVLFVNRRPPTSLNQFLFLLIWAASILCTAVPISFALNSLLAPSLGRTGDLNRALRQGLLLAIFAGITVGLRFLRMITPGMVLLMAMILILLEAIFYIKRM